MYKLLKSLILKSAFIQKQIDHEHSLRSGNWLKLIRLKKIRLKIKDRINSIISNSARKQLPNYRLVPVRIKSK